MSQSRRERLLAFVISVILCCMMSGSLSLIAKKSRDPSAVSTGTARLATPHDDVSPPFSDALQHSPDGSPGVEVIPPIDANSGFDSIEVTPQHSGMQEMTGSIRTVQSGLGGNFVTGAILCLGAAMCCAITAVGALLLLRGPPGDRHYAAKEGGHGDMETKEREGERIWTANKGSSESHGLVRDELDEIAPEEAV